MQKARSIAFTCDFLRSEFAGGKLTCTQFGNLDWLVQMLDIGTFERRWGINAQVVIPSPELLGVGLGRASEPLLALYKDDPVQGWAQLYDGDELPAFKETIDRLLIHDLIVGFELPPVLKKILHEAGKRYLSLYIHPARFLRDLCFFATSNCGFISDAIARYPIPEREVSMQLRRIRAMLSRRRPTAFSIPSGVPVIAGQTQYDAALIDKGRFASLTHFQAEMEDLLRDYTEVLYLEHPYATQNRASLEFLRSDLRKTVVSLRTNAYGVIFSDADIPCVISLSSSLGIEAGYAGQRSEFLLSSPLEKFVVPDVDLTRGMTSGHDLLGEDLWSQILDGDISDNKTGCGGNANPFVLGNDYLRGSLESWAYRGLTAENLVATARKRLIPSANAASGNYSRLVEALLGADHGIVIDDTALFSRKTDWGSFEAVPKPVPVGGSLIFEFNEPAVEHFLHAGFHSPEPWGVWSSEQEASIRIPVANNEGGDVRINFKITIHMVQDLLQFAPVLVVDVDGVDQAIVLFRSSAENAQNISFAATTSRRVCEIRLKCTHGGTRHHLHSSDTRPLSFAVSAFECSVERIGEVDREAHGPLIFGLPFQKEVGQQLPMGVVNDPK